jgi:branched-chain amino acid transport system substrate-binding protein
MEQSMTTRRDLLAGAGVTALAAQLRPAAFAQAKSGGVKIDGFAANTTVANGNANVTSGLLNKGCQNVGVVGMTMTGSVGASNFTRQFRDQNIPALLLAHGLTWFPEWYDLTGDASNFAVTMDSPRVIAPYQREWVEHYTERFGEEPAFAPSGHSYDYMRMAITILNEAGTLDFDTLVETTLEADHQGIWHRYNFAREPGERAMCHGEVEIGGFEEGFFFPMVQMMDGETRIIWPLEHAEAEFQQPPWI